MFVGHHADIVQTVEIWQSLKICSVFDKFLCSAVEQSDMRICTNDFFTIELQDETKHTVGSRVLRSKVHSVVPYLSFARIAPIVRCHIHMADVFFLDRVCPRRIYGNQPCSTSWRGFCSVMSRQ